MAGKLKAAQVGNPINLTGQVANIATATAFAVPAGAAGLYRVSVYIAVSSVATTSGTMPAITIGWTDPNGQAQTVVATATLADNALTDFKQAVVVVNAAASSSITYATGSYASSPSSGAGALAYELSARVEAL